MIDAPSLMQGRAKWMFTDEGDSGGRCRNDDFVEVDCCRLGRESVVASCTAHRGPVVI